MKKIIAMVALVFSCMLAYAQTNGEVIVMNKAMFIKDVFDYEKSQDWKYKGNKPAIIDLYADWCGPCRMVAPIMKELAKEYADKIVVYKVNVDKEKELAALFNATSIPLFVFIPMNGEPPSLTVCGLRRFPCCPTWTGQRTGKQAASTAVRTQL